MPKAGKSSLISQVSSARPKVADSPFTTLYPNLGVVSVGLGRSFVIADIPGIIEGAAEGAGLGTRFLKHLSRTSLLLHVVDLGLAEVEDIVTQVRQVEAELEKYDAGLAARERWMAMNKIDLLPSSDAVAKARAVIEALGWQGPVFNVSALTGEGCDELVRALMKRIEALRLVQAEVQEEKAWDPLEGERQ